MARENKMSIGAQLKKEMVNYIGPIFEELKTEIKYVREELKTEIKGVREELTDKINWQGTIMEQMNKKIDVALELAETTQSNSITVKEHTTKIVKLERDVKVLKDIKLP